MKGDWICSCGEFVFARAECCRQCGALKPKPNPEKAKQLKEQQQVGYDRYRPQSGNTRSSKLFSLKFSIFGFFDRLLLLHRTLLINLLGHESRDGDWICRECSENNFAYRKECFRCREPR